MQHLKEVYISFTDDEKGRLRMCALWFFLKVYFSEVSRRTRSLILHPSILLVHLLLLSAVPQSLPESILYQLAVALQHGLRATKVQLQQKTQQDRFNQTHKHSRTCPGLQHWFRWYSVITEAEYWSFSWRDIYKRNITLTFHSLHFHFDLQSPCYKPQTPWDFI